MSVDAYAAAVEHHKRMLRLGVTTLPPVEGLAHCPFCLSIPRWRPILDEASTKEEGEPVFRVGCWWCGAEGPAGSTPAAATVEWNRRG